MVRTLQGRGAGSQKEMVFLYEISDVKKRGGSPPH